MNCDSFLQQDFSHFTLESS